MKIHMVKSGDTLYEIAKKYNVELEKLIAINPQIVDPNVIEVGMKVKIPNAPMPVMPPTDYLHKHVVVQGDTLWKLGKSWNVPLQMLIKANPQLKNPNILMTGEIVYIPKMKAAHEEESHSDMHEPMGMEHHVNPSVYEKPNTAPMPAAPAMPVPAPIAYVEQPEAAVMPPYQAMPMPEPVPMPSPMQMEPQQWDSQQITLNLFQQYDMPATEAVKYDTMKAPESSMWGEPAMYPMMMDCGCGASAMPYPYAAPMGASPFQQPQEMNYLVMPANEVQSFAHGMDAATWNPMFPGGMESMQPMHAMPMQLINAMPSMNAMYAMPPMGMMNPMGSMTYPQTAGYGFPYAQQKPDCGCGCGCGCHDREKVETAMLKRQAEDESLAETPQKAEKASVRSTGSNRKSTSLSAAKAKTAKRRKSSRRPSQSVNRSPWLGT